MKLTRFSVKGYRSLRDVTLDGLGDFNVFYGPNGSGKSNILEALQTFFCILPLAVDTLLFDYDTGLSFREAGTRASRWIYDDDFFARADTNMIVFGATLEASTIPSGGGSSSDILDLELRFSRDRPGVYRLECSGDRSRAWPDLFTEAFRKVFSHLPVTRTLRTSVLRETDRSFPETIGTVPDGEIVRMLFEAKNSSDREVRQRYDRVRHFMAKILDRGEFDVFMDADKNLELRERLPDPNPRGLDIRIDNAGHGVVQMYAMVAPILLTGSRIIAVEEPEAHLHAPTLGRELRTIFQSLVTDDRVDQLFIATHSNLFDLDLTGYWDVSLVDGETRVARKHLDEIDHRHLYEPGPAKHQLQELLRLSGDEIVFRTADGRAMTAKAMLAALQNDEDVAQNFLETMHAAALQVTGLRARRTRGASG